MSGIRRFARWGPLVLRELTGVTKSRLLVSTLVLFALFGIIVGYVFSQAIGGDSPRAFTAGLPGVLMFVLSFILPAIAVLVSSDAIARKHSRGTLRVILGLPFSRADVVVGTFLARALVVTIGLVVCVGLAALVVQSRGGEILIGRVIGFLGITVLFAAGFVSVGIALSAQTGSITRVVGVGLGIAAVFSLRIDNQLIEPNDFAPELVDIVLPYTPVNAFELAAMGYYPELGDLAIGPITTSSTGVTGFDAVVILFGWVIIPLVIGYTRFRRVDR